MKCSKLMVVLVGFAIVLALIGCHDEHWWNDWWEDWDLEGQWEVTEVDNDDRVVNTYLINIEQRDKTVHFLRDHQRLSSGWISVNLIGCNDWYDYGIDLIYIDSDRYLHSERPENRQLKVIRFSRLH